MSTKLPVYPFDPQRCIGTVSEVGPTSAKTNLPDAARSGAQWHHGQRIGAGEVGEFVVIECGEVGIFGRLISINLPERERLSVEPELGRSRTAHPLGTIQLLTTILISTSEVTGGISQYPRLGSKVYSAHPQLIKWIGEASQKGRTGTDALSLQLASLPFANDTSFSLTPEALFGRHCAVLGATGGGKSWTLARLIEQTANHSAKVILIDASGEFYTLQKGTLHAHLGCDPDALPQDSTETCVPHDHLTEEDLFALFKPSGQTQAPKLRQAMKSLKLAKVEPGLAKNGVIIKAGNSKQAYEEAERKYASVLDKPRAAFDINHLINQIEAECVYSTSAKSPGSWGDINQNERTFCTGLVTRIESIIKSSDFACIFQPGDSERLSKVIDTFLKDVQHQILRVSLRSLPFANDVREIIVNAIGRYLLREARSGRFKQRPLLIVLDEAHQFLNKILGDENNRYPLESFELIAKEGRKYSLNLCIATQRPRDIPEGVLSQMGTLLVHRLVNDRDREVVERASGDIDRSAAAFLPTLAPGQAVIIGVDFPIPLTIQISRPECEPDSRGPDYQAYWKASPSVEPPAPADEEPKTKAAPN